MKLPSAEEHKEALYALYTDEDGEPCWPETPKLLEWSRAYALDVLDEAANEVADCFDNEEDYFPVRAAILKMKEKL